MRKFREKASANYQLQLRADRDVKNAFRAYQTSWETERLESERNRQIYCELIDLGRKENSEAFGENSDAKITKLVADKSTIDDNDSDVETQVATADDKSKWWTEIQVKTNRAKTLADNAIHSITKDYNKGPIDARVWCQDAVDFGLHADIDLPLLDLMELDNETFWKRLVQEKLSDVIKFQELLKDRDKNWKKLGLELKFSEFIGNLEKKDFDYPSTVEHLHELTKKLEPIVDNLTIRKLKPQATFDKNPFNPNVRVVNVPSDECHRGSLEFLGSLKNLKRLFIRFDPGNVGFKYERRFFQVSVHDIENVGKALMMLKKLEDFTIHRSDLSAPLKILHLLTPMGSMNNLKFLDLSFCSISSKESGEHFEKFLSLSPSLERLELKGNKLDYEFCYHFARGIKSFEGKFEYLGLSLTPILGNGLGEIAISISEMNNVHHLDVSSCDTDKIQNTAECIREIINLLEPQRSIRVINVENNNIANDFLKEKFISTLCKNFDIDEIYCATCGFTSDEMVKIKVLLLRNKYLKDNPLLNKKKFTAEDEIEIEKFLARTKHPLLLKYKKPFTPQYDKKPHVMPKKQTESCTNFFATFRN